MEKEFFRAPILFILVVFAIYGMLSVIFPVTEHTNSMFVKKVPMEKKWIERVDISDKGEISTICQGTSAPCDENIRTFYYKEMNLPYAKNIVCDEGVSKASWIGQYGGLYILHSSEEANKTCLVENQRNYFVIEGTDIEVK